MLFMICVAAFIFATLDKKSPNNSAKTTSSNHQTKPAGQNTPPPLLQAPQDKQRKAAPKSQNLLPAPFASPIQYIGLTLEEAAKRTNSKANNAGNIVIESKSAEMLISTSGGSKIAYVDIDLISMGTCLQSKEFDSEQYLMAVGIDPIKLELARKQTHFHTYYDHTKKLKIFVTCIDDNWPYTVGISKNYYLQ